MRVVRCAIRDLRRNRAGSRGVEEHMHNSRLVILILVLAAFGCSACGASDAEAPPEDPQEPSGDGVGEPPLGSGPYAVATLTIEVEHPDHDTISYELACFGDTATLVPEDTPGVDPVRACTALARTDVEDFLVDGPPSDQACTQQYGGPDTARITGRVNDRPVDIEIDRVDGCGIDSWDVLLADVLPPAVGG